MRFSRLFIHFKTGRAQKSGLLLSLLISLGVILESCGRPGDGSDVPMPTYSWINKNVIQPKCLSCHITGAASYGIDLSSYSKMMATGSVVARNPLQSRFYTQALAGAMPKGGPVLNEAVVQTIYDWINSGALDDTGSEPIAVIEPVVIPTPTVSAVSPTSGPAGGGTGLTLTGSGFISSTTVTVGGSPCTNVQFVSASSLTCISPAHSVGIVDIIVSNSSTLSATLSAGFTYNAIVLVTPSITSISPNFGSDTGPAQVTITGTGFETGATVKIGGVSCTSVSVLPTTQITCNPPPNISLTTVDVEVTNTNNQSDTLSSAYTYKISPTYSSLSRNIFKKSAQVTNCNICHTGNGFGRNFSDYNSTVSGPGGATSIQNRVLSVPNPMPPAVNYVLSADEKNAVDAWVTNGAQDN